MKITKYSHSCLLVELPDRTVLFDPGVMSAKLLDISKLTYLDDIVVTHEHNDHMSIDLIKKLVERFPDVRITAPQAVVNILHDNAIRASEDAAPEIVPFSAPHEHVEPLFPTPEASGYHYADMLTHPGDSHSFTETMPILALPVTAPWGATVKAINLAIALKPKAVIPIHDWHWSDEARAGMYDRIAEALKKEGIDFIKPVNGEPFTIEV